MLHSTEYSYINKWLFLVTLDRRTRPLIVSNCLGKPAASEAPGTSKQAFNVYRQYASWRQVSKS